MKNIKRYIREPVNGLTHAAAVLLAAVGWVLLLYNAIVAESAAKIAAFSVFGASMILLYVSSALFHSLPVKEKSLKIFQKLDHCMIFVLIAGTVTPVCLLVLNGFWRWGFLTLIWLIAATGIIRKIMAQRFSRWFSISFYIGMGWLTALLIPAMYYSQPHGFLIWILAGGFSYTVGAIIYGVKKPNPIPNWFGHHEIWHLFVMAGTFAHFWAFYRYLS